MDISVFVVYVHIRGEYEVDASGTLLTKHPPAPKGGWWNEQPKWWELQSTASISTSNAATPTTVPPVPSAGQADSSKMPQTGQTAADWWLSNEYKGIKYGTYANSSSSSNSGIVPPPAAVR